MARILDLFLDRKTNANCARYPQPEALFEGLEREEDPAIRCLSSKVSGVIYRIGSEHQLTKDDIEELICDCITIGIQKIRLKQYRFQGYDPATFVVEIAKNRAKNFRRSAMRRQTDDIDGLADTPDEAPDAGTFADVEILTQLLSKLEDGCRNLIKLKYLEERRDKEVIDLKLSQYTTIDALKNHRSKCMKKLTEIAEQWKTANPSF